MREGWVDNTYLILFSEDEVPTVSDRYGLRSALPGFAVVGLCGWDDLIVRDPSGQHFRVPAVPCIAKYLTPLTQVLDAELRQDPRFDGRIKWYVQPLVFGGDPAAPDNTTWVNHDEHAALVRWWNAQYLRLAPGAG